MAATPVMTGQSTAAAAPPQRALPLRSWRTAVGLTAVTAGAAIVTGAFLPWVEAFAGLLQIPGVRGGNGRVLGHITDVHLDAAMAAFSPQADS